MKNPLMVLILLCVAITTSGVIQAQESSSDDFKEIKVKAEQGDADAQNDLGVMYKHGLGVAKNYKEAFKWWNKAAEQGNAEAQDSLGLIYNNGQGVTKNYKEAYMWMSIAKANGSERAGNNLEVIEKKMTASNITQAQELAAECVKKNYKGC